MTDKARQPRKSASHSSDEARRRRSSARLAAVQTLYSLDVTGQAPDEAIRNFLDSHLGGQAILTSGEEGEEETEVRLAEPDARLYAAIVKGVEERIEEIDRAVSQSLTGDWSVDRLEAVVRAVLRAGTWELSGGANVPAKVVISEYVDLAFAFYAGPEPGMVNAVLDRIARIFRADEFPSPPLP